MPVRTSRQDLDHEHATLVTDWAFPQRITGEFFIALGIVSAGFRSRWSGSWHAQQLSAPCQFLFSVSVGQETVVADTLKTLRKHMEQKSSDKLLGLQCHRLLLGVVTIILVTEAHLGLSDVQQTTIGNRHAMSIAPDRVYRLLGPGERPLGVNHPRGLAQGSQVISE